MHPAGPNPSAVRDLHPRLLAMLVVAGLLLALCPAATPASLAAADEEARVPALPARLSIPSIRTRAAVEIVGLDEGGAVGIPTSYTTVAWYGGGAVPGEPGNAVITGHVSSVPAPAVFYRLRELLPGDEILVTRSDGEVVRFAVRSVESFAWDDPAPMGRIYGPAWTPRLNLVTCDGEWDPLTRNYAHRLVVFAELARGENWPLP